MHTEIVNKVLNIAGLGPNDDENNNKVFPTKLKQDARDLENICNSIHEMINPFHTSINKMYCSTLNRKEGIICS